MGDGYRYTYTPGILFPSHTSHLISETNSHGQCGSPAVEEYNLILYDNKDLINRIQFLISCHPIFIHPRYITFGFVVINYGKDGGKEAGTSKFTIIAPFAPREILE